MERRKPLKRTTSLSRGNGPKRGGRIKPRKFSKKPAEDGAAPLRRIKDECDELIRSIVALRDKQCVTCGVSSEQEDLHPGHYITRKVLALRWDLRNVFRQCNWCNNDHNERPMPYRRALESEIGKSEVMAIERVGRENPRLEYSDLLAIRDGLRAEAGRMVNQ